MISPRPGTSGLDRDDVVELEVGVIADADPEVERVRVVDAEDAADFVRVEGHAAVTIRWKCCCDAAADELVVAEAAAEYGLKGADRVEVLRCASVPLRGGGEPREVLRGDVGERGRAVDAEGVGGLEASEAGPRMVDRAAVGEADVPGVNGAVTLDGEDGRASACREVREDG